MKYYKRIEGELLLQLWLEIRNEEGIKMFPYTCERGYYGEGFRNEDLIEIDIEEFRELGREYNCFEKNIEAVIGDKG